MYAKDGKIRRYLSLSPLKILGKHINNYNEILVGLTGSETFRERCTKSKRKVILLKQYENDIVLRNLCFQNCGGTRLKLLILSIHMNMTQTKNGYLPFHSASPPFKTKFVLLT